MNFLELAKKRYSVRDFSSKEVEEEKLNYILEVARLAPSACNRQPWKFFVIKNKELLSRMCDCYDRDWFKTAPLCIIICGNHSDSWKRSADNKDHCDIDIAIATDHITLAATDVELGSCWICNFDVEGCKNILALGDEFEPICIVPIGYPTENVAKIEKKRKDLEDIIIVI